MRLRSIRIICEKGSSNSLNAVVSKVCNFFTSSLVGVEIPI